MSAKAKKQILITIAVILGIYILGGITSALIMVNFNLKKPANGFKNPYDEITGPREPFAEQIYAERDWLESQNPEQISITSFDGLKLAGVMLKAPNAKGTVIAMHGYHSRAAFEFSGFARYFFEEGYNVLLPDQRAHGNSEGKYLTFGVKERFDCRDWITFANSRFGEEKPVYLCGVSMGCATVLMTLGFDLPKNVKGVIADCGFTTPYEIVKVCLTRDYHLPSILMPFINAGIDIFCDFNLKDYSTFEALKNNEIPILFVHGTADDFVPYYMSEQNFEACHAPKTFLKTESGHAANFLDNQENYKKALKEFMK